MQTKVEQMRAELNKIFDLRCANCPARKDVVRDVLEFAVLSRGEAILETNEQRDKLEKMKEAAK